MRNTLIALLLVAPLGGLLGGTAHAEPYVPAGAPIPTSGTITREASAPSITTAVKVVVKPKALRAPVVRTRPAPARTRLR